MPHTVALMYDFDKTLSTRDMQEYSFIPGLGLTSREFWEAADRLAAEESMDRILAYMYLMIRKADACGKPIRREDFVALGRDVEFFDGIPDWFARVNEYGKGLNLQIEHYIISSGLREIIEGTKIGSCFRKIFACEYHYNPSGAADWPLTSVNYTGKTQFLFRINKGVFDPDNDEGVNELIPEDSRPVPFRNMIYIGDGLTDIPCFKLVTKNGGHSVAVYRPKSRGLADSLLRDGRVNFTAPADYKENSPLDCLIQRIFQKLSADNILLDEHKFQLSQTEVLQKCNI